MVVVGAGECIGYIEERIAMCVEKLPYEVGEASVVVTAPVARVDC